MKNLSTPLFIIKPTAIALALGLSLSLTACGNKPAEQDTHAEHDHAEHEHSEEHAEHEHHEEGHAEHADHEDHADHEGHEHHHDHDHAIGPAQVIPEGYTVNFAVSNHPLFLLSEAVTVGTPTTVKKLLNAGDVGHHGSLSPSDMKTVEDSKYVVWFGKGLESNLTDTLTDADNTVTILAESGINKLERRDEHTDNIAGSEDPHVWFDPENANTIVNELVKLHSDANPEYADTYQANAQKFAQDLDTLVAEQQAAVASLGEHNQYWASHDAFQYFEKALGIELAGTLTTDHEIPAKASQIVWLKQNRPYETMCLLAQSEPKEGMKNKLAPVVTKVLIEDMSDSSSYLEAWKQESQKMIECLK